MRRCDLSLPRLMLLCCCLFLTRQASWPQSASPQSRIVSQVNEGALVTLRGNTHPLAQPQFDQGAAPPDLPMARMLLVLKRSDAQESALQKLLDDQQDRNSPSYHQWLTPDEFGQQFGPSDQDLQVITAWLISHGFQIGGISRGRTVIEFSGTSSQVQQAFLTEIHRYVANGESHWANASDPQIPAALAPVIVGVNSMHNFSVKPLFRLPSTASRIKSSGSYPIGKERSVQSPFLTGGGGCGLMVSPCYVVGPWDFATIYNVLPLWNGASPIDGTGETIAIVGQSDIYTQDILDFRTAFGLPNIKLNIIHNGVPPGQLSTSGDETESEIDVQWAGAVAKGATIDLVLSASTNSTSGVDLSAEYVVDNNLSPILSESYGECELGLGTAGNQFHSQLWQQAASEGISVFVAAGDSGSAACDRNDSLATNGLSVSGLASTPYDVAVGGTDFNDLKSPSTYWNSASNATTQESAIGYIPEMAWNDTCTNSEFFQFTQSATAESDCNDSSSNFWPSFLMPNGGSGGMSNCTAPTGSAPATCSGGYPKPSWQTGPGVPSDKVRDLPDVSLFAGDLLNANAYLFCNLTLSGGSCAGDVDFALPVGGTSVSAQAFAGIMALVDQKTQSRQGNANYVLYPLAAISGASCNSSVTPGSACVFYDVTAGTNAMPCMTGSPNCVTNTSGDQNGVLSGYSATAGYDLATGLGSANVTNLVNNWTSVTFQPTSTTLTLNGGRAVNVTHGTPVNVNVTVGPQSGGGTPSGLVSLLTSNQQGVTNFTLSNGAVASSTALLPGGSYTVNARYAGNGTFAASDSAPGVAVTVSPEPSLATVQVVTVDQNGNSIPFTTGPYGGSFVQFRVSAAGQSGNGVATGTVTLTDAQSGTTVNFAGNPYPLNSEG
jgi:subtilase family serine protease